VCVAAIIANELSSAQGMLHVLPSWWRLRCHQSKKREARNARQQMHWGTLLCNLQPAWQALPM